MSLLSGLFDALTGESGSASSSSSTASSGRSLIYSNCAGGCRLTDDQCAVCQPYKKALIEAIYNIEHNDEYTARYEITGDTDASAESEGTVKCPYCGAPTSNYIKCEYCGSKLGDGDGKIKVKSAADIPDPVMETQNIIFERYNALKNEGTADDSDDSNSSELLSAIMNLITGDADSSKDTDVMGCMMSKEEIESMASVYSVTVAAYLTGLDNGSYLTKSAYDKKQSAQSYSSSASGLSGSGLTGAAAILGGASILGGGSVLGNALNNAKYDKYDKNGRDGRFGKDGRPEPPRQDMRPGSFGNGSSMSGNPGRENGKPGNMGRENGMSGNTGRENGMFGNTGRDNAGHGNMRPGSGRPGNSGNMDKGIGNRSISGGSSGRSGGPSGRSGGPSGRSGGPSGGPHR